MAVVKLEWESQGENSNYNVYKSEEMIDVRNLENPITTTFDTHYEDTNVEHGKVYYYVIERFNIFDENERSHSANKIVACLENTYMININSIVKLDAFGNEVWNKSVTVRPRLIEADNKGNIYVAFLDNSVTKYDYTGEILWTVTDIFDSITAMTINDDRLHLIGESSDFSNSGKGFRRIDSFGNLGSRREITEGEPISITVCGNETFVLCDDGTIVVYNSNGNRSRDGSRVLSSQNAKLVGNSKNLYLSEGQSFVQISPTTFDDVDNSFNRTHNDIVAGHSDNVYIIEDVPEFNIRKIKEDRLNGWGATVSDATAIVTDTSGNIIVRRGNNGITKLNNRGQVLWEKNLLGTMGMCTEPSSFWI